jgi:hypothetical protein
MFTTTPRSTFSVRSTETWHATPRRTIAQLIAGLLGLALFGTGFRTEPATAAAKSAAKSAASVARLLPSPFKVESTHPIDLDRDGDRDLIVIGVDGTVPVEAALENPDEGDGSRILLVAEKTTKGYKTLGSGRQALLCRQCGGAFSGPRGVIIEVEVAKNAFIIRQSSGSREVTQWTHRYRLEKGRIRLTGLDRVVTDRVVEGQNGGPAFLSESKNYLTGDRIVTIDPNFPDQSMKSGKTKQKPTFIVLEQVALQ